MFRTYSVSFSKLNSNEKYIFFLDLNLLMNINVILGFILKNKLCFILYIQTNGTILYILITNIFFILLGIEFTETYVQKSKNIYNNLLHKDIEP